MSKTLRTTRARFVIAIALLAYVCQAFGASAYVSDIRSGASNAGNEIETSALCHGESPAQYDQKALEDRAGSCCQGDCSMVSCHSMSAIISVQRLSYSLPVYSDAIFMRVAYISAFSPPLDRPPILG